MNKFHDIEVIINNKRYTLSGYESEEYLQKIASYINNKHMEFRNRDAYRFLDSDLKNILMQINIADDYHKAMETLKEMEADNASKDNELYNLKHEIVTTHTKFDSVNKEMEDLKKELNEAQKNIIRLETELNDAKRKNV